MPVAGGRLAGLTTRGRCLLAGGGATAVCAVVLDERDLLRVGVFVALLPLLALVLAARTRRIVRVERELEPARVPVDAEVSVAVALQGGALLGALRLVDAVPDAAGPQADAPPRFTVHRLSSRGTAALTYPLRPVLRGVHRVGPLTGTASDPLGLAEFERELAGPDRLLVLPRVVPLRGLPPAVGTGEGTPGAALAHQGQGASDVLIRPYRQGDELRRVHWRSSARHDELMVRLEERPWRGGMTLLLDRRDAAHRGRGADSSLEFAVSLAASVCVHLVGRGEPFTLVTEDGTALVPPGAVAGQEPLLDALAALRPSARTDLSGQDLAAGTDVLAVLGALGPGQVEALLARSSGVGHAVLLDTATWDPAADRARGSAGAHAAALRRAGWRVTVATAGTSPARVWDDLVLGAAPDAVRVSLS
ncbi:DUF58 domain-containing protein [Pseudonocardia sichuanensis]|uniref:Uncharacterized protein (DUF58 family) n=1 Tax=Pseudonocardia kunmingensis TaxID=630975 RepID=A0A543DXN8_9PSEU|nr:DUF58 domain-containing protein [Pseudonocardia kunmingensis]TQM14092.1 uncharacterized protein (DUF58 family) [Pseudonocardia kunmingensis]